MKEPGMYSKDPTDYIRAALAIETLAYLNKGYLGKGVRDNDTMSLEIQSLLIKALTQEEE